MTNEEQLLLLLGRLHPLLLHLPIGLWLGICALEFGGALIGRAPARATLALLTLFAALCGAAAAASGWQLSQEPHYQRRTVELHRWLSVAAAAIGILAALLAPFRFRSGFRLLLVMEFVTLMATGHLGSTLTHGEDWLLEPFDRQATPATAPAEPSAAPMVPAVPATSAPATTDAAAATPAPAAAPSPAEAPVPAQAPAPAAAPTPAPAATPDAPVDFAREVLPTLQTYCTQCHGADKQKGGLRLDSHAAILAGGDGGPSVQAGKAEQSLLYERMALPLLHDDHMPPATKKQPAPADLERLRRWIAAGAEAGAAPPTAQPEAPPTELPAAPPAAQPKDQEPPREAAPATTKAPTDGAAARSAAIAALRQRMATVAEDAAADGRLAVDFAPAAASTTDDEMRTLLAPLCDHIATLGLAASPVGEACLSLCARMSALTRLDLRRTRVSAEMLRALQGHPTLAEVQLQGSRIDGRAAPTLQSLPALRLLALDEGQFDDAALQSLRSREGLVVRQIPASAR